MAGSDRAHHQHDRDTTLAIQSYDTTTSNKKWEKWVEERDDRARPLFECIAITPHSCAGPTAAKANGYADKWACHPPLSHQVSFSTPEDPPPDYGKLTERIVWWLIIEGRL